jgi:hypothetical protein
LSEAESHYNFHLIFKGLFRCVPDRKRKRLSVLLVDARSGKISPVTGQAFNDHRAAIEFRLADWRNKTSAPIRNLVEVNKPVKGPVALYLLDRQDVALRVTDGQLSPALTLIEDDSATSFLKLPHLDDLEPGSGEVLAEVLAAGENCIARLLDLAWGEVRSERPSKFDGELVRWAFSRPRRRDKLNSLSPKDRQLRREFDAARTINLDVRVSMRVPSYAAVLVAPEPFSQAAQQVPAFMLRPEAGQDLEVWIKNRELDAILQESDVPGADEDCPLRDLADFDFELQYELSANVRKRRIPYRREVLDGGPVTAGGCACGGCSGGSSSGGTG